MLIYDPDSVNNRKTKQLGWVPGRNTARPTRRKWEAPLNERTMSKITNRQRFAMVTSMWALVTPAGIVAWQNATIAYKAKATAGQKIPDSAFTLFMYVNMNLLASGSAMVFTPPTPVDIPVLSITHLQLSGINELHYTYASYGTSSNWTYRIQMSSMISPGRKKFIIKAHLKGW